LKSYHWFDLYQYSLKIGVESLLNCLRFPMNREGIKRLLIPMDVPRYFELPNTLQELSLSNGERVFDLSSSKLLAFFISERMGCQVVSVDIWEKEIQRWKSLLDVIDPEKRRFDRKRLVLGRTDGRALPFPDSTFDKIYSISVIEHIPKDGDEKAVEELARVLKPGGILVLTVPFSNIYWEEYVRKEVYGERRKNEEEIFFARYYDEDSLMARVILPSNLGLERKQYFIEMVFPFNKFYDRFFPWSMLLSPLFPILYWVNVREISGKMMMRRADQKKTHVSLTLRKSKPSFQEGP